MIILEGNPTQLIFFMPHHNINIQQLARQEEQGADEHQDDDDACYFFLILKEIKMRNMEMRRA